jgi:AcrR family transcriptional regulator
LTGITESIKRSFNIKRTFDIMKRVSDKSSKDRLLDSAELAFANAGFDGASMRQIALKAKVNLATAYYYFESKEGLMVAVLKRRFDPLKEQQLELLQTGAMESKTKPLALERILHALIAPVLGLTKSAHGIELRLIGRMMTEPSPQIQELLCSQYDEVRSAFLEQFKRALPGIPLPDLFWRIECTWGALAALLCNPAKVKQRTKGLCDSANTEQLLAQLVPFFAAGFRAPAVTTVS